MISLQKIFLINLIAIVAPGTAFAIQDGPSDVGSVYPGDVVAPISDDADTNSAEKYSTRYSTSKLEQALGPASYLITDQHSANDFTAAIRRAVGRHPSFHASSSDLGESDALRRQAKSALYPQLSAQLRGDYSLTREFAAGTDNVVESLRPREQYTAGISASQLIFDGGATIQRIRGARAVDREYRYAMSTQINNLALSALTAYHDVAAHQALVAFTQAFIQRNEQILEDVKERERLGAGSKADVTRAFARLSAAKARLAEIRESKRFADINYEEFFGEVPPQLKRPGMATPDVTSRNETVATALEENPEVSVAQARVDARQADFKVAKSARLPEVRLSVDAVKYDIFEGGDDFDVRAGLNINYNIFGGGSRAAEIAIARSRARKEKFNEEQVRKEVARDAAMAFERLQGADARLASLADALVAHDETRDLVLERYKLSRGDLIDVLQAENDYFDAGVAYLIGLSSRDIAGYALMEHTGDLLRLFSPENEYNDARFGGVNG
ncbi:TolC family protein [Hyphococcus formosus]|uniref:TolC family protein n=1 Tax=Hyphococcus formosus TaxID=3143534 RepID=UPI00398A9F18